MAECLIRAKGHWKDSWTPAQVNKLSIAEKEQYDARTQLGDIVVIRPDGWEWGREECLPNFILVKIPDMTVEEAKQYEDSIMGIGEYDWSIRIAKEKWDSAQDKTALFPEIEFKTTPSIISETADEYVIGAIVFRSKMFRFRKHFLKPTWVNTIISQGGVYTINKATVINYIEAKVI